MKNKLLKIIPQNLGYDSDSVTFFEGSNGLYSESSANNFRNFLIDNKIRHNVITNLEMLSDEYLLEMVGNTLDGVIAFETTGLSKEFDKIKSMIIKLSNKGYRLKFIECVIDTATIRCIPKEAGKSLQGWSLYCFDEDVNKWEIRKVKRK